MNRVTRRWGLLLGGGMVVLSSVMAPLVAHAQPVCDELRRLPPALELTPGMHREIRLPVEIERLAVGNPAVADVQLTSERGFLISPVEQGATNVTIWTPCSQRPADITLMVTGAASQALGSFPESIPAVPAQVQTDIRFVEVNRTRLREIGVSLFGSSNNNLFASPGVGPGGVGVGNIGSLTPGANVPLSSSGFNLVVGGGSSRVLAALSALESSGFAYTLARPSLVALSGQSASFLAGGEFPIPVPSAGSDSVSIEYKEFGVRLTLTPTVIDERRITLKVAPEVSELDFVNGITIEGTTVPALSVRRSDTSVSLASGESFIISGLISTNRSAQVNQLPGLGSLPVIGAFFRNSRTRVEERELLMIVTPHLVQPLAADALLPPLPGEAVRNYDPSVHELLLFEDGSFDRTAGLSR
ncbi:type II and III secretion system protein family protein [Halomonas aquamarina]|uniref:Type II and III secretion system protein family protein n=1 Tax=Vreelandella aquamarina TaxID=77097 RepID=A0ACC5VS30_9GAMM|nr:type II and III secretion system protein family protein [Halomonas aquamarina]MBZ5487040.1 type II and III secretion system protein family protein [Halomonas aquamarina]